MNKIEYYDVWKLMNQVDVEGISYDYNYLNPSPEPILNYTTACFEMFYFFLFRYILKYGSVTWNPRQSSSVVLNYPVLLLII